jgi:hypothetical protein
MCEKKRVARAPFKPTQSMGVTYINDAEGFIVAAMAAPREMTGGPLTVDEQKRWIADNAALFLTAPRLVQYIRAEVIAAVRKGAQQIQAVTELQLLADAMNTSVEWEWQQVQRAIEAEEMEAQPLAA